MQNKPYRQGTIAVTAWAHCQRQVAFFNSGQHTDYSLVLGELLLILRWVTEALRYVAVGGGQVQSRETKIGRHGTYVCLVFSYTAS